ncbi:MAG: PD40 domain-containing protein [Acidobacteria bacterium]|nr:PD40 domain-containing protein [Acidobacteriota bacterium]
MKRRTLISMAAGFGAASRFVLGQEGRITVVKAPNDRPVIAIPDLRGNGAAQQHMAKFNEALWTDVESSGVLKMAPKSMYPMQVPQQPSDLRTPSSPTENLKGLALNDWYQPPASAGYLAYGYTAVTGDQIVLSGWLSATNQPSAAPLLAKRYFGPNTEEGARKVAQEFAADIMGQFGGKSLMGTKIYFVSDRTGKKEIWSMNYDGSEQKPITSYNNISSFPALSQDGTKIAFTTWREGTPQIYIHSLETGRKLVFYNQRASMNASAEFTPDGQGLLFSSTAGGGSAQIYRTDLNGGNVRRISTNRAIEVEPRVNPKTGQDIVFVSGRLGSPQLFKMSMDGTDVVQLTPGDGEAVNPSWHPDGQKIAFAWTKGFDIGNFNIFIMDVASKQYVQLTHGAGRNENPSWAPDGMHIVFSAKRGRTTQIYSMLADGTNVKQLTSAGNNEKPVWSKTALK